MKFSATITGWGEDAFAFLDDPDNNMIIIFNENAPEDLKEISVLHTESEVYAAPEVGDTLILCDKVYDITAVGEEAKNTLKDIGHATLCFKGKDDPERPGIIMLQGDKLSPEDIKEGGTIEIY